MFSMSLAALELRQPSGPFDRASILRKTQGTPLEYGGLKNRGRKTRSVHFGGLDDVLPGGGLPRGAVVEIAAPYGLARATSIALSVCVSTQAEAKLLGGEGAAGAWCAWIEPTEELSRPPSAVGVTSLFAPAIQQMGIDVARFLVMRPPAEALARVAVRVAASRVFSVLVIDLAGLPGYRFGGRLDRWVNPVRRLAMAVEALDTTVVLLTDSLVQRLLPLPVAMRLEIERAESRLLVTVAKDRLGRVASARSVMLPDISSPASPQPPLARASRSEPAVAIHA